MFEAFDQIFRNK